MLTVPLRHVHPAGQCNRAMSAVLSRHNAEALDDEDEGFGEETD